MISVSYHPSSRRGNGDLETLSPDGRGEKEGGVGNQVFVLEVSEYREAEQFLVISVGQSPAMAQDAYAGPGRHAFTGWSLGTRDPGRLSHQTQIRTCHNPESSIISEKGMRSFKPGRKQSSFKGRRYIHGKKRFRETEPAETRPPRINKDALRLLAQIGTPERTPFVPDPFQIESLEKVMTEDVLVSAPTGSGKTWIALEATKEYLSRGCGIWYATPLKALSNAKYQEFGQILGPERVGILTGDRKENADAPVIVGTTEILRNQLYDSMQAGIDLDLDLVILDEAHYLGDPDRGVVWEEVSIYLPARVRLLLLSATISNAATVAAWLTNIRGTPCSVVYSGTRPVPLYVLFRSPDGHVLPFFLGKRLHPEVASYAKEQKGRKRFAGAETPYANDIVETLRHSNLLPAIVFLKSRSDCDKALNSLMPSPLPPYEDGFEEAVNEQLSEYPELRGQRQLTRLLATRAGSHHAGQLPGWRLLVERMMVQGHLEVIFSTSTVAAGVNFPARTVVILQSDRFNGRGFVDMTSTDLHQMTGRAGRRGMDNAGFTLVVPGKFLNIPLLSELLLSPPEPLPIKNSGQFLYGDESPTFSRSGRRDQASRIILRGIS